MGTLRDQILAADDLPRERVVVDEWAPSGVPAVFVRGFSAKERDEWELSLTVRGPNGSRVPNPKLKNVRANFVARLMVDENGDRIIDDRDIDAFSNKSAAVLERLMLIGLRLSGMATPETEAEEANPSMGDQEDISSSDSPSPSA